MRRVFTYLLIFILIFACLPLSAAAVSDVLTIDNAHRYDGMNQTYAQGYMPIVSGGKASIVLPLISDIPLENNRINVALGLGDTSSAPFVYNSYNRDFSIENHAVDDGANIVYAYLVSFELPLKSDRVNGVYPVTVTITAKTVYGDSISQSYTLYITVTDGKNPDQTEEPPVVEPTPIPVTISIDSSNAYTGMSRSYANGYIPTIKNDTAVFVLPLQANGDISGDLDVTPNLGSADESPFVFANYAEKISRSRFTFDNNSVNTYLAVVNIPLQKNRVNGVYPVIFTVTAKNTEGSTTEKSFTLYLSITDGKPGDVQDDSKTVNIYVDNINTYPGMRNSYAQGYVPTVEDDKVHIRLPLLAEGDISGSLTVKPDLGDPQDTPFVLTNYEKSVAESTYQFGSQNVKAYLVDFAIPLASDRINGYYPVVFAATAIDKDGKQFKFSYTVYVTIKDGKDPAGDGEETPTSSPKLIVSASTTEPDEIQAGDNFKTLVTIKNTSSIKAVQNITVKISSSSEDVFLENDSTPFYFSNLDAGKTLSLDLMLRSTLNVKPGRYFLNLDISYDDMIATPLTSSEMVAIDIGQHFNVVLETPQIDTEVYAGDTIPLEFKVINMGRSAVHNVQCELTGFGLFPNGSAYFGNLEAESESSKEINIFIGSLDMSEGYTGTDKYGFTEGTITLTYEDDDGTEYSGTYTIQTTIKAAEVPEATEETDTVGQWWVSVLIVMILVLVCGGYLLWRRKRRIKTYEEK